MHPVSLPLPSRGRRRNQYGIERGRTRFRFSSGLTASPKSASSHSTCRLQLARNQPMAIEGDFKRRRGIYPTLAAFLFTPCRKTSQPSSVRRVCFGIFSTGAIMVHFPSVNSGLPIWPAQRLPSASIQYPLCPKPYHIRGQEARPKKRVDFSGIAECLLCFRSWPRTAT